MDDGKGSATAGVMDDLFDDTLDVAVPLGIVDGPQSRGSLAMLHMTLEDGTSSLTLGTNHTSHFTKLVAEIFKRKVEVSSRKRKRKSLASADFRVQSAREAGPKESLAFPQQIRCVVLNFLAFGNFII